MKRKKKKRSFTVENERESIGKILLNYDSGKVNKIESNLER
jgi:hypothetical protein